jgi:hypothetical protein
VSVRGDRCGSATTGRGAGYKLARSLATGIGILPRRHLLLRPRCPNSRTRGGVIIGHVWFKLE